jgi:hypothetical protein
MHSLQSCHGRHFTWIEKELSLAKLSKTWSTTFNSLQFDSKHFKHAMNTIMELQSEVPQQHKLT